MGSFYKGAPVVSPQCLSWTFALSWRWNNTQVECLRFIPGSQAWHLGPWLCEGDQQAALQPRLDSLRRCRRTCPQRIGLRYAPSLSPSQCAVSRRTTQDRHWYWPPGDVKAPHSCKWQFFWQVTLEESVSEDLWMCFKLHLCFFLEEGGKSRLCSLTHVIANETFVVAVGY